jgi:hypothetical protein
MSDSFLLFVILFSLVLWTSSFFGKLVSVKLKKRNTPYELQKLPGFIIGMIAFLILHFIFKGEGLWFIALPLSVYCLIIIVGYLCLTLLRKMGSKTYSKIIKWLKQD